MIHFATLCFLFTGSPFEPYASPPIRRSLLWGVAEGLSCSPLAPGKQGGHENTIHRHANLLRADIQLTHLRASLVRRSLVSSTVSPWVGFLQMRRWKSQSIMRSVLKWQVTTFEGEMWQRIPHHQWHQQHPGNVIPPPQPLPPPLWEFYQLPAFSLTLIDIRLT